MSISTHKLSSFLHQTIGFVINCVQIILEAQECCMPNMLRSTNYPNKPLMAIRSLQIIFKTMSRFPSEECLVSLSSENTFGDGTHFKSLTNISEEHFHFWYTSICRSSFLSDTFYRQQDRFYLPYHSLPSLKEVGFSQFTSIIEEPFRNVLYESIISVCRQVCFTRC